MTLILLMMLAAMAGWIALNSPSPAGAKLRELLDAIILRIKPSKSDSDSPPKED